MSSPIHYKGSPPTQGKALETQGSELDLIFLCYLMADEDLFNLHLSVKIDFYILFTQKVG